MTGGKNVSYGFAVALGGTDIYLSYQTDHTDKKHVLVQTRQITTKETLHQQRTWGRRPEEVSAVHTNHAVRKKRKQVTPRCTSMFVAY